MEIRPVKKYAKPRFPTNEILEQHPEFLRIVPKRWRSNQVVLTALAGLCFLMTQGKSQAVVTTPDKSHVAPIFVHGNGQGSFGCMSISPPVFLSEAEARQIINDEVKRYGIKFEADTKVVAGLTVPITDRNDGVYYIPTKQDDRRPLSQRSYYTQKTDIKFDGTDPKRHISYEVITDTDFKAFERTKYEIWSSVEDRNYIDVAKTLQKSLSALKPSSYFGVFYDPVGHAERKPFPKIDDSLSQDQSEEAKQKRNKIYQEYYDNMKAETRKNAEDNLRAQVQDFIKWLKGQGVI